MIRFTLIASIFFIAAGCGSQETSPDKSEVSQPLFIHSPAPIRALTVIDEADLAIRNEMDIGYLEIARGHYEQAIEYFSKAESQFILENPNSLPWIGKAEALCRSGKNKEGRYYTDNFRCALEIENGDRKCSDMETGQAKLRPELQPLSLCHEAYCAAEIVRPQYEDMASQGNMPLEYRELLELTHKVRILCSDHK